MWSVGLVPPDRARVLCRVLVTTDFSPLGKATIRWATPTEGLAEPYTRPNGSTKSLR